MRGEIRVGVGILADEPSVDEVFLGDSGRVEAYYYGKEGLSLMAVQPDLSDNARRAREIEAYGYHIRPPYGREKFCTWPDSVEDIDPLSVRAQKRCVEHMEPEWLDRVKREWEGRYDEASVVFWSELPPETVHAILEILWERGEIGSPE